MPRKRKKESNLLVIILCLVAMVLVLLALFLPKPEIIELRTLDATINVSDRVGFDLNGTCLTFGNVIAGGSSTRTVNLENTYSSPLKIKVISKGDIARFVENQEVFLQVGEKRKLEISAQVPKSTSLGVYSGKIVILVEKIKG